MGMKMKSTIGISIIALLMAEEETVDAANLRATAYNLLQQQQQQVEYDNAITRPQENDDELQDNLFRLQNSLTNLQTQLSELPVATQNLRHLKQNAVNDNNNNNNNNIIDNIPHDEGNSISQLTVQNMYTQEDEDLRLERALHNARPNVVPIKQRLQRQVVDHYPTVIGQSLDQQSQQGAGGFLPPFLHPEKRNDLQIQQQGNMNNFQANYEAQELNMPRAMVQPQSLPQTQELQPRTQADLHIFQANYEARTQALENFQANFEARELDMRSAMFPERPSQPQPLQPQANDKQDADVRSVVRAGFKRLMNRLATIEKRLETPILPVGGDGVDDHHQEQFQSQPPQANSHVDNRQQPQQTTQIVNNGVDIQQQSQPPQIVNNGVDTRDDLRMLQRERRLQPPKSNSHVDNQQQPQQTTQSVDNGIDIQQQQPQPHQSVNSVVDNQQPRPQPPVIGNSDTDTQDDLRTLRREDNDALPGMKTDNQKVVNLDALFEANELKNDDMRSQAMTSPIMVIHTIDLNEVEQQQPRPPPPGPGASEEERKLYMQMTSFTECQHLKLDECLKLLQQQAAELGINVELSIHNKRQPTAEGYNLVVIIHDMERTIVTGLNGNGIVRYPFLWNDAVEGYPHQLGIDGTWDCRGQTPDECCAMIKESVPNIDTNGKNIDCYFQNQDGGVESELRDNRIIIPVSPDGRVHESPLLA